ncbi:MAG: 50S ribosomal protein L2 [Desulfurococcales archaeon]|nr:50S ribosomal protein L2 [Desulfurococcales archaeon]
MGKRLIQQRAGRGTPTFRSPKHIHPGSGKYPPISDSTLKGRVIELIHDPGRYVPLAKIVLENGARFLTPVAEGVYVGQVIQIGPNAEPSNGNILPLGKIPEGTQIFNVELRPGDGGKLARQSGSYALVVGRTGRETIIKLPSGKQKSILNTARATIGIPAGGGRIEKPILKAGNAYHKWKRKAKKWPKVRGVAMYAATHPHGGGSHQSEGHPTTVARNTPPGRKVGHIAARRTGRRKR